VLGLSALGIVGIVLVSLVVVAVILGQVVESFAGVFELVADLLGWWRDRHERHDG
jgi:hypothetical protein